MLSKLISFLRGFICEDISYKEVEGVFIVSGSYNDMKEVFPKLKSKGFRYNPSDKSWRIKSDKLTDVKRKNVMDLLDIDKRNLKVADEKENVFKDNLEIIKSIPDYKYFKIKIDENKKTLGVSGKTYDVKNMFYNIGAKWSDYDKSYVFDLEKKYGDLKSFFDILKKEDDNIGKAEKISDEKFQKMIDFAKEKMDGKEWLGGSVSSRVRKGKDEKGEFWFIIIESNDKKYRDAIKLNFVNAVWNASKWWIKLTLYSYSSVDSLERSIKGFLHDIEEMETDFKKDLEDYKSGSKIRWSEGSGYSGNLYYKSGDVIVNKKKKSDSDPDYLYVLNFESKFFKEDGLSFGVGDDSGYIYTITARPATDEESAGLRKEREKELGKAQALKNLYIISKKIVKDGEMPKDAKPEGRTYYLSKDGMLYGGGDWFVVGTDKIWYIRNNGMDGDNWANNNVMTGGAGAIGWYVPYKEELAKEIEGYYDVPGLEHLKS